MSQPLVSIIIPLHNAADYIDQTIKSCLVQSYGNIEIIVVENGSQDGGLEVVKGINDTRLNVFDIGKASSMKARNFGFSKSSGIYIQYLDAEDQLSRDKIENQINLLSKNPIGTLVSCAWGKFTNTVGDVQFKKEAVWKSYNQPTQWLIDSWMGGGMMQTACWLTHRELIEKAGPWNEALEQNPNDDGEFFCRIILNAKKIIFDKKGQVFYRMPQKNSVSRNKSERALRSLLASYKSYECNSFKFFINDDLKKALGNNYLTFIYQHHQISKELTKQAEIYFKNLNIGRMWPVGGTGFRYIAAIIGLKWALKLKSVLSHLKS